MVMQTAASFAKKYYIMVLWISSGQAIVHMAPTNMAWCFAYSTLLFCMSGWKSSLKNLQVKQSTLEGTFQASMLGKIKENSRRGRKRRNDLLQNFQSLRNRWGINRFASSMVAMPATKLLFFPKTPKDAYSSFTLINLCLFLSLATRSATSHLKGSTRCLSDVVIHV